MTAAARSGQMADMRSAVPLVAGLLACTPQPSTTTPAAASPTPSPAPAPPIAGGEDPRLWLEEVLGERPLAWVRERNAATEKELTAAPGFAALRARLLAIYDSKDRIPSVSVYNRQLYNFWQDEAHPQGLWRRTTLAEYKKPAPRWETVLDLDALAAAEKEGWVWHGASCLYPKYDRCLVHLSRGGADAEVVREFDTVKKAFVADGFTLPEARSSVAWKDRDTLYVATDFGPDTLTRAGTPRIVKEWRRGTPLSAARTLFEGAVTDLGVDASREVGPRIQPRDWLSRATSFYTSDLYLFDGTKYVQIDKPADATFSAWEQEALISLRSAWTVNGRTWPAGALLTTPLADYLAGKREFTALFEPRPNASLETYSATRSAIFVTELVDVNNEIYVHRRGEAGWTRSKLDTPAIGSFRVAAYDSDVSDDYWFYDSSFTSPYTLWLGAVDRARRQRLKANPAFFKADGIVATQHFATSRDGVKIPYFQVAREGLALDGSNPTLLTGYGGFEISMTPDYDATAGAAWLERGGVVVVANIRGGGEYGPEWHKAAIKHQRQRAYDDFIAVAEDLIARKVTTPARLGTMGGSNGGLLVGVMLTQRPDLFGAVVCQVPLLDMQRYARLPPGSFWLDEYGDPDNPEDWAALAKFSPYHNVKPGTKYPRTLFTTSTRDDRVHPGHARKMAALLQEHGQDVLYFENIEGGHGAAANHEQAAHLEALAYTFLARQLGLP